MNKEKTIREIKDHSVYSKEIYKMHSGRIDDVIEDYEKLKESYLEDHSRARIVRIVFEEDEGLPLAIEFNRKDDSFKGFTIAIGKPYINSDERGEGYEEKTEE
ncbi:MAG: hypothetical protein GXO14_02255 [Thermococci archaeon]|nr:hypothetical protein [Thermococci archaeon]